MQTGIILITRNPHICPGVGRNRGEEWKWLITYAESGCSKQQRRYRQVDLFRRPARFLRLLNHRYFYVVMGLEADVPLKIGLGTSLWEIRAKAKLGLPYKRERRRGREEVAHYDEVSKVPKSTWRKEKQAEGNACTGLVIPAGKARSQQKPTWNALAGSTVLGCLAPGSATASCSVGLNLAGDQDFIAPAPNPGSHRKVPATCRSSVW